MNGEKNSLNIDLSGKNLTLQEFFLHAGAGCMHPDNREVREIRTLYPQL